jgi:choline dehydrogenase-like flavoprotein
MTQYDYIVIGAGSAGCVVANRLTEDPDTTVLLLEAGNHSAAAAFLLPILIFGSILLAPPGSNSGIGFTGIVTLTHPQNIGSVSLRSPDPKDAQMIRINYLQNKSDVQKLIEGVKLLRQLFHTNAFDLKATGGVFQQVPSAIAN